MKSENAILQWAPLFGNRRTRLPIECLSLFGVESVGMLTHLKSDNAFVTPPETGNVTRIYADHPALLHVVYVI
jgi:hypothetical protein